MRAQTCPPALWVIVDDGSTDTTWAVLQQLAASEPRLRLNRQPRGGLTKALIAGCAMARGGRFHLVRSFMLLILLSLIMRTFTKFDPGRDAIQKLATIVTYAMLINVFFVTVELFTALYGNMPHHVVTKIVDALNARKKSVNGSRVLVLGVAYKKDISDVRESPALDVIQLLLDRGAEVLFSDPYAAEVRLDRGTLRSAPLTDELLAGCDCTVIVTDHSCYDYARVVEKSRIVVDTRNATRRVGAGREKIARL